MRNGNGVGSFILGLGLGAVAGLAINRWMDTNKDSDGHNDTTDIQLDKQEIANLAQQFIHANETVSNEGSVEINKL